MSACDWDENPKDYVAEYYEEETQRENRLHTRVIKTTMDRLRRALRMEVSRGKISPPIKDRFIMTPLKFLSKSYTKINLEALYRRYRQIRIQALTECLAIVGQGGSRDENIAAIREKIVQSGEAHRTSQKREDRKNNKCAAY